MKKNSRLMAQHSALCWGKVMTTILCSLTIAMMVAAATAQAQQPAKIPRVGFLSAASSSSDMAVRIEAFRQGLRVLGYVEGKNIVIEYRYAAGKLDRLPDLAAELVRLNVNVIVTAGGEATPAAKKATSTIPIVMGFDLDPVGNGLVTSLARPGGNITGLSTLGLEISGKLIELLKEIVPSLSQVAVLGTSTQPGSAHLLRETELAARAFGVKVQLLDILGPKDIETAFRAAGKGHADGVLVLQSPVINSQRTQVADLAVKSRLPGIFPQSQYANAGGLMYYGVNTVDLFRRAPTFVDKILKGRKPADLPIEQPTKFELVINLKTGKQIGVTIPQRVLERADRVIK